MATYTLSLTNTALPSGATVDPQHIRLWLMRHGILPREVTVVDATTIQVVTDDDPTPQWAQYDNPRARLVVARTALAAATTLAQLRSALILAIGGDD